MPLYDFSKLKPLLDLDGADIAAYPDLEVIADAVEARITDYLGRTLELGERTETRYQRVASRMMPLAALPVLSVASVTLDGQAFSDWAIDPNIGLRLGARYSGEFVVTYSGGLDTAPEWLARALTYQIVYEYQNKDHIGADYVSTEGGSVGRPALNLLADVKATLNPHRHPVLRIC